MTKSKKIDETPIAVIGISFRYPGVDLVLHMWENILTRRQQFRLVRPFIPASAKKFIENPCERPFNVSLEEENVENVENLGEVSPNSSD